MAKLMVKAMGLKSLPSRPSRLNKGKNTTMMINSAKPIGFATSLAASSTALVRLTGSPDLARSVIVRKAFSTMTTAPSAIIPIPTASPASDIKFADISVSPMNMNAISIAIGSATITTSAERSSPRNKNSTIHTKIAPATSAVTAVSTASFTKSVRSYTGLRTTPSGKDSLTISTFSFTEFTTFDAFSPTRESVIPRTTSLPSRVTAPKRMPPPCLISAMSLKKTGVPSLTLTTMSPMSVSSATRPKPRTKYCSRPRLTYCPPTCALFTSMTFMTSVNVRSYLIRFTGSTIT